MIDQPEPATLVAMRRRHRGTETTLLPNVPFGQATRLATETDSHVSGDAMRLREFRNYLKTDRRDIARKLARFSLVLCTTTPGPRLHGRWASNRPTDRWRIGSFGDVGQPAPAPADPRW